MSTRSEGGVVVVVIQNRETTCQHGRRAGGWWWWRYRTRGDNMSTWSEGGRMVVVAIQNKGRQHVNMV